MQITIPEEKNTHDVKRMGLLPKTRLVALGFLQHKESFFS